MAGQPHLPCLQRSIYTNLEVRLELEGLRQQQGGGDPPHPSGVLHNDTIHVHKVAVGAHGGHSDDAGVELSMGEEVGQVLAHTQVTLVGYDDRGAVPQQVVGEVLYDLEEKRGKRGRSRRG